MKLKNLKEMVKENTKYVALMLILALVVSMVPCMPRETGVKAADGVSISYIKPVRTGDMISPSDFIRDIRVDNYSPNYSLRINSINTNSVFALTLSGPALKYKALKVGVATISVTVSDNEQCLFPVTRDVRVVVYPRTLEEAVNVVVERLQGRYLTVNGKSCTGKTGHTNCSNCNQLNTIKKAQWLKDLFPEVNFDKANFQQSGGGWTCWGGAQIIVFLINELLYGGNAKLGYTKTASCNFTKSNVQQYARIGDHIRLNSSHSVVLLGINNDNTIKVIDVNSGRNGKDNHVEVYDRKIKNVNMKVYKIYVK